MSIEFKGTTICAVKKDGITAIAGDGQVTFGESIVFKNNAVKVTEVDVSKNISLPNYIAQGETVLGAYEVKLLANQITVQPDKGVTVKLLIPGNVKNRDVKVLRITDDGKIVELEATKDDGYAVFDTEYLAKFVIVSEEKSSLAWLWILLSIIAVLGVIGAVVTVMVKVGKNEVKVGDKSKDESKNDSEEKKND
jgi:hypothetical protein